MVKNAVRVEVRVIYGDTDMAGVVYYGNYLRYFEIGRNEYLRALGIAYRAAEEEHRFRLPVVEALTHYKQPARYDDLLTIETTVSKLGRASLRFEYRVLRGDAVLVTGHTLHACVDFEGKLKALPAPLRAQLAIRAT